MLSYAIITRSQPIQDTIKSVYNPDKLELMNDCRKDIILEKKVQIVKENLYYSFRVYLFYCIV